MHNFIKYLNYRPLCRACRNGEVHISRISPRYLFHALYAVTVCIFFSKIVYIFIINNLCVVCLGQVYDGGIDGSTENDVSDM